MNRGRAKKRLPSLRELRAQGVLRAIDQRFAERICQIGGDNRPELLLLAALCSAKLGEGHVCLQLDDVTAQVFPVGDESEAGLPTLETLRRRLLESSLCSKAEDADQNLQPLILDAKDRLYLRRYWQHEQAVASQLLVRAQPSDEAILDSDSLREQLDRFFGEGTVVEDRQRRAALMAAMRNFCVVSGGPGTGKTFTVAKILALLVENHLRNTGEAPRILLLAPTGKAAARLVESIEGAREALDTREDVKAAIRSEASTIHRALGSIASSQTRFRYNADNPLVADIVLVDEASMVNVALMSRLLDAVPEQARLILLGDKDQLASVEAGAVMADICNQGQRRAISVPFVKQIAAYTGERLELPNHAPAAAGIWDCVTTLTKSYRYREGSGIQALAVAINAGDADAAIAVLRDPNYSDVQLAPSLSRQLSSEFKVQCDSGYQAFLDAEGPSETLQALNSFRVLCAHHRGEASVELINQELRRHIAKRRPGQGAREFYDKRPLMVGVNDYELKLFNGDTGVVLRDGDRLRAFFEPAPGTTDTGPRSISPSRLPEHASVYAMSIHKSQGSEFADVAIVLPPSDSPVLTRELIYTAVTRAKNSLCIHASEDTLRLCIKRPTQRSSGLRDLLYVSAVQAAPVKAAALLPEQPGKQKPASESEKQVDLPDAPSAASHNLSPKPDANQPSRAQPAAAALDKSSPQASLLSILADGAESTPATIPPATIPPAVATRPSAARSRGTSKTPKVEAASAQLAFDLDASDDAKRGSPSPSAPRAPKQKTRKRARLRPAPLQSQVAKCCGHRSAALLRCPRCQHVWVECCSCEMS